MMLNVVKRRRAGLGTAEDRRANAEGLNKVLFCSNLSESEL
jgi:hypothetical protein